MVLTYQKWMVQLIYTCWYWKNVKKSLIQSKINVGFKIVTCVLINYGKCKM
jgi:hypothetical protein